MKKFWKFGLLSVAAATFFACGDDSSSNSGSDEGSSSSAAPIVLPTVDEINPVEFSNLAATVMSNGRGGEALSLSGSVKTANDFVVAGHADEDIYFQIDDLKFLSGKVENGSVNQSSLDVSLTASFPAERVNLATSVAGIDLDAVEGCGEYRLYILVNVSEFGETSEFKYTGMDSLSFKKTCQVAPSSSASEEGPAPEQCTEVSANSVTLSNIAMSDQKSINFETGLAENPDITLAFINEVAYLKASEGVTIYEESNQMGALAEGSKVCSEQFAAAPGTSSTNMEIGAFSWYVVKTPHGDYTLMAGKFAAKDRVSGTLDLTYYK